MGEENRDTETTQDRVKAAGSGKDKYRREGAREHSRRERDRLELGGRGRQKPWREPGPVSAGVWLSCQGGLWPQSLRNAAAELGEDTRAVPPTGYQ